MDPNLEGRRRAVLELRLRHLSEPAIAQALHIHQSTVSRDLAWIREHWGSQFGSASGVTPAQEIGHALAIFESIESEALAEYHALAKVPGSAKSRARMDCLRTAAAMREKRLNTLQDFGYLERKLGSVDVNVIRADEIRVVLQKEGLLGNARRVEGEQRPALSAWLESDA